MAFTGERTRLWFHLAVLFALKQLAERIGLLQVLGPERWAKLVCFSSGPRRPPRDPASPRSAGLPSHAGAETLGLKPF